MAHLHGSHSRALVSSHRFCMVGVKWFTFSHSRRSVSGMGDCPSLLHSGSTMGAYVHCVWLWYLVVTILYNVQYCTVEVKKTKKDLAVQWLQHSDQSKLRIMWMTLLEQRQQKAINSLTDDQFAKLTDAKAAKRFDLLAEEHKALFMETIPKLIKKRIQDRKIKKKMIDDDHELERVSFFVLLIVICLYTLFWHV